MFLTQNSILIAVKDGTSLLITLLSNSRFCAIMSRKSQ